ncbi:MAG: UDP-N-acetylmuramate--L-alanine ligase [Proteobacteria bacterium]|nr:UDP-N-acetylmuramate--L-alanine ligase [Pseudomonadota bacterium]
MGNCAKGENTMDRVNHIHFVGIGGAGMSGIAEVLHNLGYQISGSDMRESRVTNHLRSLGIKVELNHHRAQVNGCDVVVVSSAIADDNPELIEAREKRIPVIPRAEMLAELMRFQQGIAVAGTHGKTTTTSLVASILAEGGLDPTYVIGGLLNSSGTHARLGTGKYLVAEADESDASFLHLQPTIAILTNVDADHLETYGGDINCLQDNFIEFLHHLPFHGLAIICLDDEGVRKIMGSILKPFKTYGFDPGADYFAHDVHHQGQQSWFQVSRADCREWLQVKLNLPGKHNVLNALAAIAVAHEVGVADASIISALAGFQGIARRCQVLGDLTIQGKKVLIIDDYAHHPREIDATLQAVRSGWPDKRVVVIFQPHRYTRTRDLFEDFCQVLAETDRLLLLEIYSAGEKPVAGADGRSLCRAIRQRGQVDPIFIEKREEIPQLLENFVEENDLLLVLGAGDVGLVSAGLLQQYG